MAKAKLIIQPITQKTGPQPVEQFSWLTPDPYLSSQPQPASQLSSREVEISGSVAIGRAPDNTVCLPDDRVERYHAIIEERGGSFWLNDFGSAGGTLLNGAPVMSERPLRDGDVITLANAVRLTFRAQGASDHTAPQAQPQNRAPAPPAEQPAAAAPVPTPMFAPVSGGRVAVASGAIANSSRVWQWSIPVVVLLVILGGGLLVIRAFFFKKDCGGISFAAPLDGATFSGPLKVKLSADQPECIQQIKFSFDDQTLDSTASKSFEIQLDPQRFRDLQPGLHNLTATATAISGGKLKQDSISLRLNYRPETKIGLDVITIKAIGLAIEIEEYGNQIIFEPELIQEIERATASFISSYNDAAFEQAKSQKQDILSACQHQGFHHQAVGFILAFSRSQFSENADSSGCGVEPGGIGYWRLPRRIIESYGGDKSNQAETALKHLNSLCSSIDYDLPYAIACFGAPNADMRALIDNYSKAQRHDLWAVYKTGGLKKEEKNRLVCFFAAGIVAENPRLFNLTTHSITELY